MWVPTFLISLSKKENKGLFQNIQHFLLISWSHALNVNHSFLQRLHVNPAVMKRKKEMMRSEMTSHKPKWLRTYPYHIGAVTASMDTFINLTCEQNAPSSTSLVQFSSINETHLCDGLNVATCSFQCNVMSVVHGFPIAVLNQIVSCGRTAVWYCFCLSSENLAKL